VLEVHLEVNLNLLVSSFNLLPQLLSSKFVVLPFSQSLSFISIMVTSLTSINNDHEPVTWPVQSFAISNDFKSPGPALLLLDRANVKLGLVYQTGPGVAVMAQFPDTEEPVYFQVSKARAACTRFNNMCKKVCILMQHFQLDFVFTAGAHAADFLQRLGRIATKVGNLHFEVHEAAS
jgi:histone acetyltransferase HTATIP